MFKKFKTLLISALLVCFCVKSVSFVCVIVISGKGQSPDFRRAYSSSETGSHHSVEASSPGISTAR